MLSDQVLRLNEFKKRWPVVEITPPVSYNGRWVADWPDGTGSSTVTRYELYDLLDELERRGFSMGKTGAPGERPS